MITSHELRQKYLEFFKSKGHVVIPSASLLPDNDPTVLFNTAGMQPLIPNLLGQPHEAGTRIADAQKCVRTVDIDGVGDSSHLTFFEMLGNWSLGDYFKKEAIEWSWEFLIDKKWLGLDKRKLSVTVFGGDKRVPQVPRDDEAAAIWRSVGVSDDKIAYMPGGVFEREDNWWGPAGQTGPCGSSTEMFYWVGETEFPPVNSNVATDKENWLEIWNDVFMQFNRTATDAFLPLAKKNVDTGMGLDRTIRVLNGYADIFQIDTLWPLIQKIEEISGREYIESPEITKSMRIVADHIRTATMIMGDDRGVAPSNVDQGYIVRRLIRRAVRHGRNLGLKENFCSQIAEVVIKIFSAQGGSALGGKDVYPEVNRNREFVLTEMAKEESKFRNTIEHGLKIFEQILKPIYMNTDAGVIIPEKILTGKKAFDLYQSYGFPVEMFFEEMDKYNINYDRIKIQDAFHSELKKHQETSRAGAEQKFAGGLADHSEMSTKYHTATHLLHVTLLRVLGSHATQKGSNITQERMRFDFAHPQKMTPEEIKLAEDLVNRAITRDYPVSWKEMSFEEAKEKGAIGLFADKYQEKVKVYTVGDVNEKALADPSSATYSREVCGGPHVEHTGTLGKFKIVKEEAVSAGVRRIKAVLQ